MSLNVNVEYVLREQTRLEVERRNITRQVAEWVKRCAALTTFCSALSREEQSQVNAKRALRKSGRVRTAKRVLTAVENAQTRGENDAQRKTTECALQGAR